MADKRSRFVDVDTGLPSEYARRVNERMLADAFFMARFRHSGYDVAAAETCERFGCDPRASRCQRCGRPVSGAEARAQRATAKA